MANEDDTTTSAGSGRRSFLLKGGVVAAGAALGATVLDAGSASAADLTPIYLPVGPFRWFDSRDDGIKISTGQTWKLTGTPVDGDFAYCFNVTVTDTFGKGWLAVYPGDAAFEGTSSINWFGNGQDLANNAFTAIEQGNAGIRIRCGGGGTSTHFILDLVAVMAFIDLTTPAVAQRSTLALAARAGRTPYRRES